MVLTAFIATAVAAALPAQPARAQSATASMSVGATVVNPAPEPAIAIRRGAVTVSNVEGVTVGVEGGTARRTRADTVVISAGPAGAITVTLTY